MTDGVKIKLVSKSLLDPMPSTEKIQFILEEVQAGKILVLEHGLTALEEAKLIEATMGRIDPDGFSGIEMQGYGLTNESGWKKLLRGGRTGRPRMVVIGPAGAVRGITKDHHSLQAVLFASRAGG